MSRVAVRWPLQSPLPVPGQREDAPLPDRWPPLLYGCLSVLVAVSAVMACAVQEVYRLRELQQAAGATDRPPRVWVAGNRVSRQRRR